MLAGTLLGFVPGVITDNEIGIPDKTTKSDLGFIKRYDDFWLDYKKVIPYPFKMGMCSFLINFMKNRFD